MERQKTDVYEPINTLQDFHYQYDPVGNIVSIDQLAPQASGPLGGAYTNNYAYDKQYRLTKSNGAGDFPYSFGATYSPSGRMGSKFTSTPSWQTDLLMGYDDQYTTHQPRTIFNPNIGNLNLFWDANGNLAQMVGCKQNKAHFHEWDEDNRLRFAIGEKFAGCYGYDGNGERTYKLTGTSSIDQVNSGYTDAHVLLDNAVLYPSPYLVVTPKTYTKHYYAGTERLATVIGMGGFADLAQPIDQLLPREEELISSFYSYYKNSDPFLYDGNLSKQTKTTDINKEQHSEIDYQCESVILSSLDLLVQKDILFHSIAANEQANEAEYEIFSSHGDHLGSAHWITDQDGVSVQYLHYAPYGELMENQAIAGYDERYKYTGKERDKESGYDYFGARYYSPFSFWLSVDPLADKYPNISPYAYCGWNPVNAIDPNGMDSIYVNDQPERPSDCGIAGETYTAIIIVVQNGVIVGEYRGSSYPNSTSNSDNSTPYNTIDEGDYPFNNEYGHNGGLSKGLNIVDSEGKRLVPGKTPNGENVTIKYGNVHSGTSDRGNYNSRGSKACITIHPDDADAFFSHFVWTNNKQTTGTTHGRIFISRDKDTKGQNR